MKQAGPIFSKETLEARVDQRDGRVSRRQEDQVAEGHTECREKSSFSRAQPMSNVTGVTLGKVTQPRRASVASFVNKKEKALLLGWQWD